MAARVGAQAPVLRPAVDLEQDMARGPGPPGGDPAGTDVLAQFDELGYVIIEGVIPPGTALAAVRDAVGRVHDRHQTSAAAEAEQRVVRGPGLHCSISAF
jgi:hypothetical protein